ncbi:MAG: hypothetical protein ACT4OZ_07420 [Gemmatimonadota bacterium]
MVAITDRDSWGACTDNIVVVDARRRRLTWVPRDVWSAVVGDRVNEAFARGGHSLLQKAVEGFGFPVLSSVVFLRSAAERAVRDVVVTVPVDRVRRFWYPLEPTLLIEDGAKLIRFDPPHETLSGERIHQWIGARSSADDSRRELPDLDRIRRQQVFVRCLLDGAFDFSRVLAAPDLVQLSSTSALDALRQVRATWRFGVLRWVTPMTIDGRMVLVRRRFPSLVTRVR